MSGELSIFLLRNFLNGGTKITPSAANINKSNDCSAHREGKIQSLTATRDAESEKERKNPDVARTSINIIAADNRNHVTNGLIPIMVDIKFIF
jgi:hypothetical protein